MTSSRRGRALVVAALVATASSFLLSCGGGTEIAPSDPLIEGQGLASASIGGRDFGASSQTDAGVSSVQTTPKSITDERVPVRPDGYIVLANGLLTTQVVTVTGLSGAPTYCQGAVDCFDGAPACPVPPNPAPALPCDFRTADQAAGLLQVSPTTTIPAGSEVLVDYTYNRRLLSVNLGLTFPSGQFVTITAYHIPSEAVAPVDITQVVESPPIAPFPMGFSVLVQTNLTTSGGRELFQSIDDPSNLLHFSRIDFTNEGDPCLEGTLSVMVRSDVDPTPVVLTATFSTPGC